MITIAGVVTVPVAVSARNNLKTKTSLRAMSTLRGVDHSSHLMTPRDLNGSSVPKAEVDHEFLCKILKAVMDGTVC